MDSTFDTLIVSRKQFYFSLIISHSLCRGICSKHKRTVVIIIGRALKSNEKKTGAGQGQARLIHMIFSEKKSKNEEVTSASDKERAVKQVREAIGLLGGIYRES